MHLVGVRITVWNADKAELLLSASKLLLQNDSVKSVKARSFLIKCFARLKFIIKKNRRRRRRSDQMLRSSLLKCSEALLVVSQRYTVEIHTSTKCTLCATWRCANGST